MIPARGGSKRIPRKNLRPFLGMPMIAWTINAARESGLFHRVLVSTEDLEIANVSKSYGAEVPFLRGGAYDDTSPTSQATLTALREARSYWNEEYDSVTQLMPNCPLRKSEDIKSAIEAFETKQRVAQISCFRFGWMNPWWAFQLHETGVGLFSYPDALDQRSQDLPELFCPTGAIWIALTNELEAAGSFYSPNQVFEPLQWDRAVDIDDESDFKFATAVGTMSGY